MILQIIKVIVVVWSLSGCGFMINDALFVFIWFVILKIIYGDFL